MPKLEFSGEERFATSPDRLYSLLTDLDGFGASIPDLVSAKRIDERTLEATVRPGFSFLRGTMKLKIVLDELVPHESALMRIDSQGIGVVMKIESRLKLEPDGAETKLLWHAAVTEMKGLVATVSPGLVQAAAEQVLRDGWRQLHARAASAQ